MAGKELDSLQGGFEKRKNHLNKIETTTTTTILITTSGIQT